MKKFPFYKQLDSMQCGIACLRMVCKFYGKSFSIDYLSKCCYATNEGVSLLGISDAAKKIGFNTIGGYVTIKQLENTILPCILHWNQNHFVVLYNINNANYYIADPSKGLIKYSLEEFRNNWINVKQEEAEKGVVLLLKPGIEFEQINTVECKINKDTQKAFRFLWEYLIKYYKYFCLIISGLGIGCLLQLIMPFLTQSIVDVGIKNQNIGFIWLILLGELMIVVGRTATDFMRRWLLLHISMRINISLLSDFFIKLLKLPMSFFDTKLMGDLLQRMNDHSRIQTFLTSQVLSTLFSILSFVVFGIVLFIYDRIIFGVFFLGSIFYGIWISLFLQKRKILDYELFEKQAINQNKTYQFITTMQEIKLQDCEKRRRWEWEDVQADLFNVQMKSLKLQQIQEAGSIFIKESKNIFITVMAATAVINSDITLGAMLAVQYIVGQLNSPVEQLMSFIYSLQDVRISLERINEIHKKQGEDSSENLIKEFADNANKSIIINNIDFKYDIHALRKTLDDISFTIPEGKITAIVGASGSGKTTLIKLMLGYYSVLEGEICIASSNLNNYNLKWWRKQCGVVMQDGVIFSESIARNIAVDDGEIDEERLKKAAKISNIYAYIMGLPLKFNTKIGKDGIGLSQGQKQRILIARAVYKNPQFIFLDEATNALDAKNERAIVENLNEFYKGRTVVVVAHRLSTVKNADQIIVLDSGKVVETGNHASLIEKQGTYYNLVKNQLELGN